MALDRTNDGAHSGTADAQAMADWSERLGSVEGQEASSLRGSLEARLEVAQVAPEVLRGDPAIAALIGRSENVYRGLSLHADPMAQVRAQLTGAAVEEFTAEVSDADLGHVPMDHMCSSTDKSYGHLLYNTCLAQGFELKGVGGYYPKAQMSAEDLGLDMSEVEDAFPEGAAIP